MAKVLLVEDNRDNRDIYRTILEYAGHAVIEAVNGAEALPFALSEHPDLIVMDVTMPIMDGLEATRRLRADTSTRNIPILILTAHALSSDVTDAMEAGATSYLSKPCAPRTVLEEVARLLTNVGENPLAPGSPFPEHA
jgi:two-component system cell cycle response regulator DivK